MKLKKLVAIFLASTMAFSLAACGSSDSGNGGSSSEGKTDQNNSDNAAGDAAASGEKLVIWTLADDLKQFAERYTDQTGVETEVVVIAPEDYPTKVQTALVGGETEPDVIVAEPQMLGDMFDYGAFANLDEFGAQDYADQIVDYVWEVGQDADGVQRAISYQITPAGIYYRRDIAQKVFGTEDPEEVAKLFADYSTILQTAQTLKDQGYRIFASDSETNYFSGDSAWVIDGKLNVDKSRIDYMDLVVELYQRDLTAYAAQWSTPWYQAMSGPVPVLNADIQGGYWNDDDGDGEPDLNVWDEENFNANVGNFSDETTEVFAFGLPAWGVIEASQGDTVSLKSVLEAHKDDTNPTYGNEKMYAMWLELAEGIDYSKVTQYDKAIGDAWGAAISAVKTGEMTKEEAINGFYDSVQSTYPDLIIER